MLKNILGFIVVLSFASLWIYYLYLTSGPDERLKFPTSIPDIQVLSNLLQQYSESHLFYLLVLFSSVYLYKQAFAIPGSVFLNLLAGALFGPIYGFILCSFLSALGASACFLLSKYITYVIVERFFPIKLLQFQNLVATKSSNLFWYLISLRLFPMTPNWALNMCSPLARVPLNYFFFSVLMGLGPYNFLTVQAGNVLGEIKSIDEIITMKIAVSMTLLAVALLGPIIIKRKLKRQRN